MRIGIAAPAGLQKFWEHHLRQLDHVQEVEMVTRIEALGTVDACLFGPSAENPVDQALELLKHNIHLFWLLPLPEAVVTVNKFIKITEESGTSMQFLCWPVQNPALQRMMKIIPRPDPILIHREITESDYIKNGISADQLCRDEIAFSSFWFDQTLHDVSISTYPDKAQRPALMLLQLFFGNGCQSTIRLDATAMKSNHQRSAMSSNTVLHHNISESRISRTETDSNGGLLIQPEPTDKTDPARFALELFFKSINNPAHRSFNSYELKKYCSIIETLQRKRPRY